MNEPLAMPTERPPLHVRDVPESGRYEATLGGDPALASLLDYSLGKGWIALLHTEVIDGYEGQGIGSRLVSAVLDDARQRGLKVVPKCPFVARWLERHPEQQDVLSRPLATPEADDLEPA